jgi:hypothetical protein
VIFIGVDLLRKFIKAVIRETADEKDGKELLTEPDMISDEDPTEEMSVVANIAGVTTPLGTGPAYPNGKKKKKKKKKKFPLDWQKSGPVT